MYCPYCSNETKVLESRLIDDSVRRRRECNSCEIRFTTYEKPHLQLKVVKKNGQEQIFDSTKILLSIQKACSKADTQLVQELAKKVETKVLSKRKNKISTKEIGRVVLMELKKFDKMAYVRFATIHKSIDDPRLLKKEVSMISRGG